MLGENFRSSPFKVSKAFGIYTALVSYPNHHVSLLRALLCASIGNRSIRDGKRLRCSLDAAV